MDNEQEVIKQQMDETRTALTEKLELLENRVTETVTGAAETVESVKNAVQDTVQSVKDTVRETVDTVTETLDLRKQVEKHPWTMVAGATAVGFVGGCLISRVDMSHVTSRVGDALESPPEGPSRTTWEESSSSRKRGNGYHAREEQQSASVWTPAVEKLKGLAIGAMFGVLRDVVTKALPPVLEGQVGEVIDGITTSLGGKTISGRILPESSHDKSPPEDENWEPDPPSRRASYSAR